MLLAWKAVNPVKERLQILEIYRYKKMLKIKQTDKTNEKAEIWRLNVEKWEGKLKFQESVDADEIFGHTEKKTMRFNEG